MPNSKQPTVYQENNILHLFQLSFFSDSLLIFWHHMGHIILKNTEPVKTESITTATAW